MQAKNQQGEQLSKSIRGPARKPGDTHSNNPDTGTDPNQVQISTADLRTRHRLEKPNQAHEKAH